MLCVAVMLALVEEREHGGLKGELGRGSYVDLGEHSALGSRFCIPSSSSSSHHFSPCLPLSALVHPQRWLLRSGLARLWVIYSSAAVWGPLWCSAAPHQHGGRVRCSAANPLINLGPGTTMVCLGHSQ